MEHPEFAIRQNYATEHASVRQHHRTAMRMGALRPRRDGIEKVGVGCIIHFGKTIAIAAGMTVKFYDCEVAFSSFVQQRNPEGESTKSRDLLLEHCTHRAGSGRVFVVLRRERATQRADRKVRWPLLRVRHPERGEFRALRAESVSTGAYDES